MPIILRDEDTHIAVSYIDNTGVIDHVPAHVYKLRLHPITGELRLMKDRKRFEVPEVKFGKHNKWKKAITSRYDRLGPNQGVLLHGMKGSGKSALSEDICNWMLGQDLPALMVDVAIPASLLLTAIRVIGPCIIYFDEFGKVYTDSDDRNMLLTLFSDTSLKGALFVVTGNYSDEFTDFMFNRPGRFELCMRFGTLSLDTAKEIGEHYHLNETMMQVLLLHTAGNESSVDIATKLCRVLRECKTLDDVQEQMEIMNVPPAIWYNHAITEVFLNDELISGTRLAVRKVKNDVAEIAIMSEKREILRTVMVDFNDPSAQYISKRNSQVLIQPADGHPTNSEHLRCGEYTLKVDEGFRITFYRSFGGERNKVYLNAQSPQEKEEARQRQEEYNKRRADRSHTWNTSISDAAVSEGMDDQPARPGNILALS